MKSVAVLGVGHIGGSVAVGLRAAGLVVVGWDLDEDAARRAAERQLCDMFATTPETAAAGVDVVVLASPVRAIGDLAARLGDVDAVVTDVGSSKGAVVEACERALGARFVGGHPLAGTERAGPDAADPALFRGRRVILTPTARTERAAVDAVTEMWRMLGASVVEMEPARHDAVMAQVSHLPHVVAYALASAIGAAGDFVGLTGGGFLDTTRIASTPPRMWIDVFLDNREAILAAVAGFEARLGALRGAIERGDAPAIEAFLAEARDARERTLGRKS